MLPVYVMYVFVYFLIDICKYFRLPKSASIGNYLGGTISFVQDDGAKKAVRFTFFMTEFAIVVHWIQMADDSGGRQPFWGGSKWPTMASSAIY